MFKYILLNENIWIPIEISLKFVPKGSINNNPALFQIMAWRRPGDKPLSEPMMVSSLTHICVTRPQWVKAQWITKCRHWFMYSSLLGETKCPTFCKRHFQTHFLQWNYCILIQISSKYVLMGPTDNILVLVQIMVWRRSGDNPLSAPMMALFTESYTRTISLDELTKNNFKLSLIYYGDHWCSIAPLGNVSR